MGLYLSIIGGVLYGAHPGNSTYHFSLSFRVVCFASYDSCRIGVYFLVYYGKDGRVLRFDFIVLPIDTKPFVYTARTCLEDLETVITDSILNI